MICACPKCNARSQIDRSEISGDGTSTTCPECKAKFWISQESFARRAFKKDGRIYCVKCDGELNHLVVCRTCGVMCPDYFVVQTSKPAAKKVKKVKVGTSFSFGAGKTVAGGPSRVGSSKTFAKIVSMLVIIAIITGVVVYYHQSKEENTFVLNYIKALYGVKSGKDMCLKQCMKFTAEMKGKAVAGQPPDNKAIEAFKAEALELRNEINAAMLLVSVPPKKYVQPTEKLSALHKTYEKFFVLATTPVTSVSALNDSVDKLEAEYKQGVQELKNNLPEALSEALQTSKKKMRYMADF